MTIEQKPEQRARVEEFQRKHRIVLLTLLFTDVVGSTRLKQVLGERAAIELTERHHALLREILARFADAEEIDTAGDSFFMVFAKPSDAVQFALLAQRAVRELARETGQPVLDRIGIHVGEVFIQDRGSERRNLFGIQIDSTARIMSLGKADQILLSRFAFDNARLVLRGFEMPGIGELSWLNHGYYELKGVEEPLEVCEVGEAGLAALTPPKDSEKAHRFHAAEAEPVLGWRPAAGQLVPETRWKLDCPLGQGGFGEVWLAQHETLKQRRVLKFCFKAERARALKREATLFRVLRERFGEHPNIVAIHDVFFDAPPYYLVTDYVDGPSLDRWTGKHATLAEVPLDQRLELVAQIADALQAAHDSGIIHRDVKPSNVLVAEPAGTPRAKLVDFGIGQVIHADAFGGVTRLDFTQTMLYTGSGTGTPLYQAPELLAGQSATTRSDIYSLGVLLWQIVLCDFTRPLATDWAEEVTEPFLREDIRRCVAGAPARRFAAAADLAKRLRTFEKRRSVRRRRSLVVTALLITTVAVALGRWRVTLNPGNISRKHERVASDANAPAPNPRPRFTGSPSCSSTSCHGGGTGRNECVIYEHKDRHAVSYGILAKGTTMRIAELLGIGNPSRAVQCTVCHAPLQSVPPDRFVKGASADRAVGCESCHGAAENWLRIHIHPEAAFNDMIAAGMRDLNDIYGRANTCIACHLNLDESIRLAGHPELSFELDAQMVAEPPHYKDERPSLGPRQWLTGQAAALRELSWKLAAKRDEALVPRWKALVWLLRKTDAGKKELPLGEDFGAVQSAADQLARNAAKTLWTKEQTGALLKEYTGLRAEFSEPKADKAELRRRAEVLVPALDRLWRAYRKETGAESPDFGAESADFELALDHANLLAREGEDFEPAKFASALEELQTALAKGAK